MMKKISDFISGNSRYSRLKKPLKAAKICECARTLARGRFEVVSFREGLLTVSVSSSAEAANLQAESESFINELNQKLEEKAVERVRFKIV